MNSNHKGGKHVHLTLFSYFDAVMLRIIKFATYFHNVNVMELGRLPSDLDLTHLCDAAVCMTYDRKYFTSLFAMDIPDTSPVTIKQEPLVPRVVNVPTNAAAGRAGATPTGAPAAWRPHWPPQTSIPSKSGGEQRATPSQAGHGRTCL